MNARITLIEQNLTVVLSKIEGQSEVGATYSPGLLPFEQHMAQIHEFIDVGEYGLAYESMVASLEGYAFRLSGSAAVKLLEVGRLFGFKTERTRDAQFDPRRRA
jgi:hypothetical protein